MTALDDYLEQFTEEPGYFDFARVGPVGRRVRAESRVENELLGKARHGTLDAFVQNDERVRNAVAAITRFAPENIAFQPNTSMGLMHAMFGLTGSVALSPWDFPAITIAAARAESALGAVTPLWLESDHGRVTPGNLRDQLTASVVAVAVSLVDYRTGYLADLDGIRQVIGDRLLIVDAIQGLGVVDAPFEVADIVVSGGQKWVRAGWGTGFLALSDRAIDHLTPVFSGFSGTDAESGMPVDEILPPTNGARAFSVTYPDPIAEARLAVALEDLVEVGVPTIRSLVLDRTRVVIELADEFAIPVVSSRDEAESAGIVVLQPEPEQLTILGASLHNHGVTVTIRDGLVRVSPHASTSEESLTMLRASFTSFATAISL